MIIFIHSHISEPISTAVNFREGTSYMHRYTCVCMHTHTAVVPIVSMFVCFLRLTYLYLVCMLLLSTLCQFVYYHICLDK